MDESDHLSFKKSEVMIVLFQIYLNSYKIKYFSRLRSSTSNLLPIVIHTNNLINMVRNDKITSTTKAFSGSVENTYHASMPGMTPVRWQRP